MSSKNTGISLCIAQLELDEDTGCWFVVEGETEVREGLTLSEAIEIAAERGVSWGPSDSHGTPRWLLRTEENVDGSRTETSLHAPPKAMVLICEVMEGQGLSGPGCG